MSNKIGYKRIWSADSNGGSGGGVPTSRTITINGVTQNLTANRTWTIGDALVANPLSQFAATTSAQLAGVISDETGTGALVFANDPTFGNVTLGGNVTLTPIVNNSLSGANQRIPSHTTANIIFTNAGLTSIGSANDGGVSGGHTLCITNATGAIITIINNYSSAAAGEAILTGKNSDLLLPNGCSIWLQYNATSSLWTAIGGGVNQKFTEIDITGTSGSGFINLIAQSSNASAPSATGLNLYAGSTGNINWIKKNGTDVYNRKFSSTNTADRVYTLQDRDGTLADDTDLALKAPLNSPVLVTPNLGTPSAGTLTNCTGLPKASVIGYEGYAMGFGTGSFSPADATIYYGGGQNAATGVTTANTVRLTIPKSGTVKLIAIDIYNTGTLGSSETSTIAFRLNNTSDTTISSSITTSAVAQSFSSAALSVAVAAGDTFEIKWTTPTWVTNPTLIKYNGHVYIE